MKHGWKNLVGLSLLVLSVTACGGKKGGGGDGAAAAPPATTDTTPDDGIPEGTDQYSEVKPGTWKGDLAVTDQDAYKAYAKKVLKCRGSRCNSADGLMRARFDIISSALPTRNTVLTLQSKLFCNTRSGVKTSKFQLKGRTAVSNTGGNGFQLAYFLQGHYSDLNILDPDNAPPILAAYSGDQDLAAAPKLQFVGIYTDDTRTTITGRVYYKGVKIAEGQMNYTALDYGVFGNYYDDSFGNQSDDMGQWYWTGTGRNRRRVRRLHFNNGNNNNHGHFQWNNGHQFNDGGFNFEAFANSGSSSGFISLSFN